MSARPWRCIAIPAALLLASCSGFAPPSRIDGRASLAPAHTPGALAPTSEQARASINESKASSPVAGVSPRQTIIDRLAAVSRGIVGHLTPSMVGEIFELPVHASSAPGWFELTTTDDALKVAMQASSPQAPIRWIEFVLVRGLGLTLADLESLYGIPYRALPPAKDGTTIVFDTSTAAVARNAYISAQLWSPRAEPASVVFQLQLRYPR